ncbi:DNA-3-methyladenine glycosylase 2 family protein [Bowmanella dokdonensis]|uniref:DNA-3-methyladenine glycosylase 2 family protein n=1 Tax=Bowmanella dokdonensis TaxID=751969 RepID=A0A939DNZ6_9ALTE|nr:AlkA N-terminal domain-containing protein [Bowmanella dokdonensis]MBN7825702.1 DNA-3-methyladenine glycosylase 2 family protein [Bowmanella dokdonensis]
MQPSSFYQQARLSRDRRFDGTFFIAVRTTGIFCRPICPVASPKEENVEYYQLAERAMEAGYRPCLRCRPDSSPRSWAWKGVDTTVERALKLLAHNTELNLAEIAVRLGVTDRYLRKLFQQRIGMAPKRYQLFQRLLFAKQLLHDTGLTVEQVAQAAGFQSARRLQDNFRQHMSLTPAQVRGRKQTGRFMQLMLQFRPPYDWPGIRDFLATRAIPGMEWVTGDSYARTFRIGGACGYFKATYLAGDNGFAIELELDRLESLKALVNEIRRVLDLDADIQLIGERLKLAGLADSQITPGLRLPGVWDPFEAGCRAILGQQVSVKAAIGQVSLLVDQLGGDCPRGRYFPTAEAISQADLGFLRMPDARRQTLQRFASYWHEQGEPLQPDELLQLKGIGPWTVNYMRMRGYSNPDIWLDSDLVIKKRLAGLNIDSQQVTPWRSYLTLQLWSLT